MLLRHCGVSSLPTNVRLYGVRIIVSLPQNEENNRSWSEQEKSLEKSSLSHNQHGKW